MSEIAVNSPATQRRRSERVSTPIPISIHGTDLLGQPFSERTTTVNFNLHGCRYTSRHQLPKNSWVTVEMGPQAGVRAVRARVVWIQKPHSIRDYFQVAIEMESPANVWGVERPPGDWETTMVGRAREAEAIVEIEVLGKGERGLRPLPANLANYIQELVAHMTNESPTGFPAAGFEVVTSSVSTEPYSAPSATADAERGEGVGEDQPLLRSVSAEIERQAKEAVESAAAQARAALEEAARALAAEIGKIHEEQIARTGQMIEGREAEWSARKNQLASGVDAELENRSARARELFSQLDAKIQDLHKEKEAAEEASSRVAQARLEMEVVEAARSSREGNEGARAATAASDESSLKEWRRRLESEMNLAQAQWNELLQSSLDGGVHRLITQVSGRAQEILLESERRISERFAELQQSFLEAAGEARQALANTKTSLEEEVARAGFSLAEIEHSTARMKEYSAQLEAASHDSLNGLHRRLEKILEDQTAEMSRRSEGLAAGLVERTSAELRELSKEGVARAAADAERLLAPHHERTSELIRELQAKEVQADDSLRLHRERLRQISEQNQREASGQMSSTVAHLRNDFENARREALGKWVEELDASGVRASHAAAESIGRTSEWFQQETRARLQVQAEQTLATSAAALDEKFSQLAAHFESQLQEKSSAKTQQIEGHLDQFAGELVGRSRSQIEEAAQVAASSFGQVVRDISGQEMGTFSAHSHAALEERILELEKSAQRLLQSLEATVTTSLGGFQSRMTEQLEQSIACAHEELSGEFARSLEAYRAERASNEKEWSQSLDTISNTAAGRYEERLQTSSDSFVMSSVRRLNEHGQNSIESLLRTAEQSIRESFSQVFDGLATILRERSTNAAGVPGFTPPGRESADPSMPRNDASSFSAGV